MSETETALPQSFTEDELKDSRGYKSAVERYLWVFPQNVAIDNHGKIEPSANPDTSFDADRYTPITGAALVNAIKARGVEVKPAIVVPLASPVIEPIACCTAPEPELSDITARADGQPRRVAPDGETWVTMRLREVNRLEHERDSFKESLREVADALECPDGVAVDLHAVGIMAELAKAKRETKAAIEELAKYRDHMRQAPRCEKPKNAAEALRSLAAWFEHIYSYDPNTEVQDDLRRFASEVESHDKGWKRVFDLCMSLGMNDSSAAFESSVVNFIRDLQGKVRTAEAIGAANGAIELAGRIVDDLRGYAQQLAEAAHNTKRAKAETAQKLRDSA